MMLRIGGDDGGSCYEKELQLEATHLGRTFALARSNSCLLPTIATIDEHKNN
jgi:hypothetical protein